MTEDRQAKAVERILETVIFENWLRFYFITQKDDDRLFLEVPQKSIEKIKKLYPALLPLADALNNREITFDISRGAICKYVLTELEGSLFPRGSGGELMNSGEFQDGLELFHAWLSLHEDQLDLGFLQFDAWLDLFRQWRASAGARQLLEKLHEKK